MDETQSTIPGHTQLQEGQLVTATFRIQKNMELGEARELIRANTPQSFSVRSFGVSEEYGASSGS